MLGAIGVLCHAGEITLDVAGESPMQSEDKPEGGGGR